MPQLAVSTFIVGERPCDFLPICGGVVGETSVSELVYDDVVQQMHWQKEQRGIDHDDAIRRTAAPLCGCEIQAHATDGSAKCIVIDLVYELRDSADVTL